MSRFGRKVTRPADRRRRVRRPVELTGSIATLGGSCSVVVEDLCPDGARLLGRQLPEPGREILLRTCELAVLGRIAWARRDHRGIVFEDEGPSAGLCLSLQLGSAR